jgi:hypothetical protein
MERVYNLKTDEPDDRDLLFSSHFGAAAPLTFPESIDLRPYMSPVVDQGSLGSCTANAIVSGLREYFILRSGHPLTPLSRLFLYWQERFMEGSIDRDAGAYIRDGMKSLQQIGVPPESFYPYDVTRFTETPTEASVQAAARFSISSYYRLWNNDTDSIKTSLVNGFPVVIGMQVYDSFEGQIPWDTGVIPMPDPDNERLLGGHAVLIVGYKKIADAEYFIVRNSWGTGWGDDGYFYLPFAYMGFPYVNDLWAGTDRFTTSQAVDLMAQKGILRSPEFWKPLVTKYEGVATSDFRYFGEAFQNIAFFARDHVGYVSEGTPMFLSVFTVTEAIDYLASKGILRTPEFWKPLVIKYQDQPKSDFRFVGEAFQNAATYFHNLGL